MSFDQIENSNAEGRPVFLYSFNLGAATWRYTSSDEDRIVSGFKWTAVPISDDGIKLTGEATTDALAITAPSTIGPVQVFIGTPPSQEIIVNVWHLHEGDSEAALCYAGELAQVDFPQPGQAKMICHTLSASMQRDGLRFGWQRACPYAVYDELTCKVKKEDHGVAAVIISASNGVVNAAELASKPDGTFIGGFIEWEHPVRGREYRGIEDHVGENITMFGLTDGLYYGLKVTAYPGCNRTAQMCRELFDNLDEFGGVPHMPGKSPFDGDPVF